MITGCHYIYLVRGCVLKQDFITPHCPQQHGLVERVIQTLKQQCTHFPRFETKRHATRIIADWIQFYDDWRPHQRSA